jgi:GT2 family glycosyltransferase/serine acetyltransferase
MESYNYSQDEEPQQTQAAPEPLDWTQGRPSNTDPSQQLLRSLNDYWRALEEGGVSGWLKSHAAAARHRFWSAVTGAEIPLNAFRVGAGLRLPCPRGVVIHPDAVVGPRCLLFQRVTLGMGPTPGVPRLGSNVEVGPGAKILGGVIIGDGARIGANAVVVSDVPAGAVAFGVPATVVNAPPLSVVVEPEDLLTRMRVLVVIVNYRTADLTIEALRSLEPELATVAPARVVVVENNSRDGSMERIASAIRENGWDSWAMLIETERNGGFAYGNNRGIEAAAVRWPRPEYVHLLNPDTVVRPGALSTLVQFMDATPAAGIAGSRLEDPDGTAQRSAFRFPGVLSELEASARVGAVSRWLSTWAVAPPVAERAYATDWVAGASMMIRREVFDSVGLLDEDYFMYFEEVDFSLTARKAGWTCWYVPDSHVVHLVGRSSGVTDPRQRHRRRPDYWFESRRRYFLKHLGRTRSGLADLAFTAGNLTWRAKRAVQGEAADDPEYFLRDFVRHSVFMKGFQS